MFFASWIKIVNAGFPRILHRHLFEISHGGCFTRVEFIKPTTLSTIFWCLLLLLIVGKGKWQSLITNIQLGSVIGFIPSCVKRCQMAEKLKIQKTRTDVHCVTDHTCVPFLGRHVSYGTNVPTNVRPSSDFRFRYPNTDIEGHCYKEKPFIINCILLHGSLQQQYS
jgi:hypothetical protein